MNGTLLGQTKGSDAIVFLYDEKANKYGFDYNGTKYYYIFNVQGDVIGILNEAGNQIVSYTYDAWGKVLSVDGSEASTIGQLNPIRYRGYYYDTETGFYYLQSRYYDPAVRRVLSCDAESVVTLSPEQPNWNKNLFAYCDNNPIARIDTGGEFWQVIIVATVIGGILGGSLDIINQLVSGTSTDNLDWTSFGIETIAGATAGVLFSAGLPNIELTVGQIALNSTTAAAHSINQGYGPMDTLANASVAGLGSYVLGTVKPIGTNIINRQPITLERSKIITPYNFKQEYNMLQFSLNMSRLQAKKEVDYAVYVTTRVLRSVFKLLNDD